MMRKKILGSHKPIHFYNILTLGLNLKKAIKLEGKLEHLRDQKCWLNEIKIRAFCLFEGRTAHIVMFGL